MSKNKNKNGKLGTKWNLSQLYKSGDDPKIEADILSAEKSYGLFAKKYKKSNAYNFHIAFTKIISDCR